MREQQGYIMFLAAGTFEIMITAPPRMLIMFMNLIPDAMIGKYGLSVPTTEAIISCQITKTTTH